VRIRALVGDITRVDADVVVNAANPSLGPGTGVNGAIRRAGGPGLCAEMDAIGHCPTGEVRVTGGHDLPARWVVHTVGPVWHGGGKGEADLLAGCYRRAVEAADALGATSIAFPAISTGVYGYPARAAAGVAVRTLRDLRPVSVQECLLVAFDEATLALYDELLAAG
jgi:O-acetyl-ADP-ribose deacetylase (regulator of RNase III)